MTSYESQLAERALQAAKRLTEAVAKLTEVQAAAAILEHQRYALAGKIDPPLSEMRVASKCAKVLTDVLGIQP